MNKTPKPAMQPLHPDKPEPPIVVGDIWIKKASCKTSVNAPTCQIMNIDIEPLRRSGGVVRYRRLDCRVVDVVSVRVFRRDWRPC